MADLSVAILQYNRARLCATPVLSFWPQAGERYNPAPFLSFFGDQDGEGRGRTGDRNASELHQPRLQFWVGETAIDRSVKRIDHKTGRVAWGANAEPGAGLIARHEFGNGWQFW